MRHSTDPAWLTSADVWYCSYIHSGLPYLITVLSAADDEAVGDDKSGTPVVRLQPSFRSTRVVDPAGNERGVIRSEGIVPGLRFVMRRNGSAVWTSTVRSVVRKRHRLQMADGELWTFDTPFYWWQHLTGTVGDRQTLVGLVGPRPTQWGFAVEPGLDSLDLLASVAFMHWKWWRW